jgi:hypothetical protein
MLVISLGGAIWYYLLRLKITDAKTFQFYYQEFCKRKLGVLFPKALRIKLLGTNYKILLNTS